MQSGSLKYLDFELEIGLGSNGEYPVAVVRSPAGEARGRMRFPFGELELENRLLALQIALLRSGGKRRTVLSPEERRLQSFGQDLFNALLTQDIRSLYHESQREAARQHIGLRLKLRIQPPELAILPWEFLYDSREAEYLCLSRYTSVVRYLELPRAVEPLTVTLPLRILGMVASPRDQGLLDAAQERQRVEKALRGLQTEVDWLPGQTWRDLQRAMRRGPWHVFHFVGHGGFDQTTDEGFIALADKSGKTRRLTATELARFLDNRSLRMVVLNSCEGARGGNRDIFSSTSSILLRRGIPAVLAMQYEITNRGAIEFARTFYEALIEGQPVDAAVAEARKAISVTVNNTVEWGAPVLYMHAPDGVLFRIREQEVASSLQTELRRLRREAVERTTSARMVKLSGPRDRPYAAFGKRLRALRLQANITTQRELVERIADAGVYYDYTIVSHWETGRRCPPLETLVTIIQVLVEAGSIRGVEDANELLRLGNMRSLSEDEVAQIFGRVH